MQNRFDPITGRSYLDIVPCQFCGEAETITCIMCGGLGYIDMDEAREYVERNGGMENSYSSPGNNQNDDSVYTTCPRCHGTGVCKSCGGGRGAYEYVDDYTGSGAQAFINCGECNGRGDCPVCHGTGKL